MLSVMLAAKDVKEASAGSSPEVLEDIATYAVGQQVLLCVFVIARTDRAVEVQPHFLVCSLRAFTYGCMSGMSGIMTL